MKTALKIILPLLMMFAATECRAERWYSANVGKWLSRDPINEAGFKVISGSIAYKFNPAMEKNIYGFVQNNTPNTFDYLGLVFPSEWRWCKTHPCCCFFASHSGDDVTHYMNLYPGEIGNVDRTKANAVKHCTWMCYVASMKTCGRQAALELGQAHEDWQGNPADDKGMDLFNNAVGVSLSGFSWSDPHAGLGGCYDRCMQAANDGKLEWLDPDPPIIPQPPYLQ